MERLHVSGGVMIFCKRTRTIAMRLLDTSGDGRRLARRLGSELLARGLSSSTLTSSLLGTRHLRKCSKGQRRRELDCSALGYYNGCWRSVERCKEIGRSEVCTCANLGVASSFSRCQHSTKNAFCGTNNSKLRFDNIKGPNAA
eukprot:IDg10321t1